MTCIHQCGIARGGLAALGNLRAPPLVSTDHSNISVILPFPEGPSWDHTACSLFGFTSVTESSAFKFPAPAPRVFTVSF